MHGRGCSKRHTVGCTDDLSTSPVISSENSVEPLAHSPAPSSGGRTRRTGLLTVMERPPGTNGFYFENFQIFFNRCSMLHGQKRV